MAVNFRRFESFILLTLAAFNHCPYVESKKNVVLFIVPNFRTILNRYSQNVPFTPNLNLLSSSSLIFHNVYSQIPSGVASRNSLLTSRRPDTIKSYDSKLIKPHGIITLPEYFEKHGYETLAFGRVFPLNGGEKDEYDSVWSGGVFRPRSAVNENDTSCLYVDKNLTLRVVSSLVCPIFHHLSSARKTPDEEATWATVTTIGALANASQNFFLTLGFYRPDFPFRFPLKYLKLNPAKHVNPPKLLMRPGGVPPVAWNPANYIRDYFDVKEMNISYPFGILPANDTKIVKQCYYGCVTFVDDMIGQVLQELGKNSLFEKTVVVVVGDHGCSLGERGLWGGHSCYDTATRVPLLVYAPGLTTRMRFRKTTHELVELVDLFPTLADLAGLDPVPTCPENSASVALCTEGVSLYPIFDSFSSSAIIKKKKFKSWKKAIFSQVPRPNECPVRSVDSDEPPASNITIMGYAVRTLRYKYIEWVRFEDMKPDWDQVVSRELYDFDIDPVESLNLASRKHFEKVMIRLREILLDGWQKCLPLMKKEHESATAKAYTSSEIPQPMLDILT